MGMGSVEFFALSLSSFPKQKNLLEADDDDDASVSIHCFDDVWVGKGKEDEIRKGFRSFREIIDSP